MPASMRACTPCHSGAAARTASRPRGVIVTTRVRRSSPGTTRDEALRFQRTQVGGEGGAVHHGETLARAFMVKGPWKATAARTANCVMRTPLGASASSYRRVRARAAMRVLMHAHPAKAASVSVLITVPSSSTLGGYQPKYEMSITQMTSALCFPALPLTVESGGKLATGGLDLTPDAAQSAAPPAGKAVADVWLRCQSGECALRPNRPDSRTSPSARWGRVLGAGRSIHPVSCPSNRSWVAGRRVPSETKAT